MDVHELVERNINTIGQCVSYTASRLPDKKALLFGDSYCTWQELDLWSNYLAYRMLNMGIGKKTHVGIWSVNTPKWIITYLAASKIGAVPVLINTSYSLSELERALVYADVEYLFFASGYKELNYPDMVETLKANGKTSVKQWIFIDENAQSFFYDNDSFDDLEKSEKAQEVVNNLSKDIDESDLACILFTSGTTAEPKGVMLSHGNLVRTALATIKAMNWQENDRMCISLPLFHCFGLTSSLLSGIILGSSMCILSNARSVNVLANIQKYECTILNGVPSMFLAIIKNAHFPEFDTKSLKSGIIAGSPLSSKEYMEICKKIPSITLLPSYGQTETSPAVSFALADDSLEKRVESVGKILPEVEVQILDLQSKKPVELMESGEIVVRGYNVMQGYYKMPEATQNTLTSDGWLYTGDIGYIDNEGYLYLVGRKKDIIIRSGENISPTEIAQALLEIDDIENAAVFGIPAEVVQEEIVACLILKEGAVFDENAIKEYLKERIAYYKIPSKFFVMESFPMTANGKVKISAIKDLILEQI